VFADNAFDFVDDSRSLCDQVLSKISKLSDLGVLRLGRKNTSNTVWPLAASEPFSVVPKECAESIGIPSISFVYDEVVGLNDDNFGATGLFELFEEPIIEAANLNDGHVASMFSCFFDEFVEKIVNSVMIGTDLSFLDHISVFIAKIDGELGLVLVDSEVQHGGLRGLKLLVENQFYLTKDLRARFCAYNGGITF